MDPVEPPTVSDEIWRPLTDDELYGNATATPPVDWAAPWPTTGPPPRRYPLVKPGARGFDDNLKVGALLLLLSLLVAPIVLGPAAAYCGYRSHRKGNPAGSVFAVSAIGVTIVNIAVLTLLVVPMLLG